MPLGQGPRFFCRLGSHGGISGIGHDPAAGATVVFGFVVDASTVQNTILSSAAMQLSVGSAGRPADHSSDSNAEQPHDECGMLAGKPK